MLFPELPVIVFAELFPVPFIFNEPMRVKFQYYQSIRNRRPNQVRTLVNYFNNPIIFIINNIGIISTPSEQNIYTLATINSIVTNSTTKSIITYSTVKNIISRSTSIVSLPSPPLKYLHLGSLADHHYQLLFPLAF